jgi:alanyl-tRNA synthetase
VSARLYYDDSYLRTFDAQVESVVEGRAYLDRSAFYPESGGQPADTGLLGSARVVDVVDEGGRVAHVIDGPLEPGTVSGTIDWDRRFDHMQQHTGQHLLSAVLDSEFGLSTVSFHLGRDACTIDVEAASVDAAALSAAERRANTVVCENRPVSVDYCDSRDVAGLLRKPSDREGTIRVVTIADLDRSACGGTHVRATGEVGVILLRGVEKIRSTMRIEFVCGARAVARARTDQDLLSAMARPLSAKIEQLPELVASLGERAAESAKVARRLGIELGQLRGAELARSMEPNSRGWKAHVRRIERGGIGDEVRAEAQAFVAAGRAAFVAVAEESGAVLVAVSGDGPFNAGEAMKALLARHGGRGGGNARMAQGSAGDVAGFLADLSAMW